MSLDVIKQRLADYKCQTVLEEDLALKEISQEVILMGLSRQKFFAQAEFHGGTALRIFYGLQRFSEDLDFALLTPDKNFSLMLYLKNLSEELSAFGYAFEIHDRSSVNSTVRKAFLKDDSIGKIITLKKSGLMKKLTIKLEVDTNPPVGAEVEIKYLDFPFPFGVKMKTLSSSFAGKLHALLCRNYIKGRDWYDFIWYVARKTPINFLLLGHALYQNGPWQGQALTVDALWLARALRNKINGIDWQKATNDVAPFIKMNERQALTVWSKDFFNAELEKMVVYLQS